MNVNSVHSLLKNIRHDSYKNAMLRNLKFTSAKMNLSGLAAILSKYKSDEGRMDCLKILLKENKIVTTGPIAPVLIAFNYDEGRLSIYTALNLTQLDPNIISCFKYDENKLKMITMRPFQNINVDTLISYMRCFRSKTPVFEHLINKVSCVNEEELFMLMDMLPYNKSHVCRLAKKKLRIAQTKEFYERFGKVIDHDVFIEICAHLGYNI